MKKKKVYLFILVFTALFLTAQLFKPEMNTGAAQTATDITQYVTVPDSVMQILKVSCYDCHSNHTEYPWYSKITPVNYWLADHVEEGKKELNFSDFSVYNKRRMRSKLESVGEQVQEGKMPLKSYTWIHKNARLTPSQKQTIIAWVKQSQTILSN